jgi:hypothetical protein
LSVEQVRAYRKDLPRAERDLWLDEGAKLNSPRLTSRSKAAAAAASREPDEASTDRKDVGPGATATARGPDRAPAPLPASEEPDNAPADLDDVGRGATAPSVGPDPGQVRAVSRPVTGGADVTPTEQPECGDEQAQLSRLRGAWEEAGAKARRDFLADLLGRPDVESLVRALLTHVITTPTPGN